LNPYEYKPNDDDSDEFKVPIFYDTMNLFGPMFLLLIPMVAPVVINDYIIGIGSYYIHTVFIWMLILWPFSVGRIWKYYRNRKYEDYEN
jgi:hypothetical protein